MLIAALFSHTALHCDELNALEVLAGHKARSAFNANHKSK